MLKFKENIKGGEAKFETLFEVENRKEELYFHFIAKNCSFNSFSDKYNDPIYQGDVVEVFIDRGEKNHYLELEVAPNGTIFFANVLNENGKLLLDYLPNEGLEVINKKENDTLEVVIKINKDRWNLNVPLRFNAYRIDTENVASDKNLFALNPTMSPTFHAPNSFIELK